MNKRQTRSNVFETNSSSTHSLIICSNEEYELLDRCKLYIDENNNLITEEEKMEIVLQAYNNHFPIDGARKTFYNDRKDVIDEYYNTYYGTILSLEEWGDNGEITSCSYTTKGGEKLVGISRYSYNG